MRKFIPLFLVAALGTAIQAADTKTDQPIPGQRVFSAGHSFHYFLPPIFTEIAKNAHVEGHEQLGLQALGGSRVEQHWKLPDDKNKAKEALRTGKVDVLTLSPIYLPDDGIENFAKMAVEYNPNGRVTVQEFWLPFDDQEAWTKRPKEIDRDSKTMEELRKAHAGYFQTIDEHVKELNTKLGKPVVYVVPVGQAVLLLREKIIAGECPAVKKQSELFTDVLGHVKAQVQVLEGYCHFAVIYRRSPVGLPPSKMLSSTEDAKKLDALLQELAWQAVTSHPLSGVKH